MSTAKPPRIIATLPGKAGYVVRVTVSEYAGTDRLDIRVWRPSGKDYRATGTGINLPLSQLALLRAALAKAEGSS